MQDDRVVSTTPNVQENADIEAAIVRDFPNGDLHDLSVRVVEVIVTMFRALDARGKLEDARAVFDICHAHASNLEIALDTNDDEAIKEALEPVIKEYYKITELVKNCDVN